MCFGVISSREDNIHRIRVLYTWCSEYFIPVVFSVIANVVVYFTAARFPWVALPPAARRPLVRDPIDNPHASRVKHIGAGWSCLGSAGPSQAPDTFHWCRWWSRMDPAPDGGRWLVDGWICIAFHVEQYRCLQQMILSNCAWHLIDTLKLIMQQSWKIWSHSWGRVSKQEPIRDPNNSIASKHHVKFNISHNLSMQ